jgi:hypothetical protein
MSHNDHLTEPNNDLLKASSMFERDPEAAVAYALVSIARGLLAMTAELRGIRNELTATRLSQP